jgi:hypothetical protein
LLPLQKAAGMKKIAMKQIATRVSPSRNESAAGKHAKKTPFEIPEGYMTGDEFERRVKARVTAFYKEHGLI